LVLVFWIRIQEGNIFPTNVEKREKDWMFFFECWGLLLELGLLS